MPYTEKQEITVAAHCLLNPLTRVRGLAPLLFQPEGPTVQLPCPEALYLGLARWAVTRNQLDVPMFRRFCRLLIEGYADLLEMLPRQHAREREGSVHGGAAGGDGAAGCAGRGRGDWSRRQTQEDG
ncbi:MAG: hypothetical protein NTU95_02100 [Methanothrix sp.]|nr:hypothetical protein [Methanothrix sp.]